LAKTYSALEGLVVGFPAALSWLAGFEGGGSVERARSMNAEEYRKLAEVEDRMWYFRALHGHIERALVGDLGARATILDAGCGTGGLISRLAPRHAEWTWTGIDLSELAYGYAKLRVGTAANGRGADIRLGSVSELPFNDGAFDAVVSADVLYHVDDDNAALREFRRVLRPGGIAVINVPAYRWLWSYHDVAVHSRRRYERTDFLRQLRQAGLAPVSSTYWNTLVFPLIVLRRKLLPPPRGGSDVQLYSAPVEAAFSAAMAVERGWLQSVGRLPFGSSVFAVARRPEK
jgi:ubiquinone/menaquinone biosynthesis C-methylase UbiE